MSILSGYTTESLKKQRQRIIEIWDKSGFLEGLSGHVNENIAMMYECCKSAKLNESPTSGDTKV